MTTSERASWKENIQHAIGQFSDQDYQERVWYKGSETQVSSFTEAVCMLFDDFNVEIFNDEWKENGLSDETHKTLEKFIDLLKKMRREIPAYPTKNDLLKADEWAQIMETAGALSLKLK